MNCDKYIELFCKSLKNLLPQSMDDAGNSQFIYLYLNNFGLISLLDITNEQEIFVEENNEIFNIGQRKNSESSIYFNSDHISITFGDWQRLQQGKIKLPKHWSNKSYIVWDVKDGLRDLNIIKDDLEKMYDVYLYIISKIESIKHESQRQLDKKESLGFRTWYEFAIQECERLLRFYPGAETE